MGYMVELNTLLGVPDGFDTDELEVGKTYTIRKDRERAFPLNIAMLVIDADWNFYGYGAARKIVVENKTTEITFEMLSLFSPEERALYKRKFAEAGRKTGEVK